MFPICRTVAWGAHRFDTSLTLRATTLCQNVRLVSNGCVPCATVLQIGNAALPRRETCFKQNLPITCRWSKNVRLVLNGIAPHLVLVPAACQNLFETSVTFSDRQQALERIRLRQVSRFRTAAFPKCRTVGRRTNILEQVLRNRICRYQIP